MSKDYMPIQIGEVTHGLKLNMGALRMLKHDYSIDALKLGDEEYVNSILLDLPHAIISAGLKNNYKNKKVPCPVSDEDLRDFSDNLHPNDSAKYIMFLCEYMQVPAEIVPAEPKEGGEKDNFHVG